MDDQMLLRYSRQILLPGFELAGQQALRQAREELRAILRLLDEA